MSQRTLVRLFPPLLVGILVIISIYETNSYSSDKQPSISQQVEKLDSLDFSEILKPSDYKEQTENYLKLEKMYIQWNDGLFGSRNVYKRLLIEYLISIIGKEILTDYNYILVSPISKFDKRLECKLFHGQWLNIIGEIDNYNILEVVKFDQKMLKKFWRTNKLISVHGTIRTFKLVSDNRGNSIILYLDYLRLIGSDSARKNSKKQNNTNK